MMRHLRAILSLVLVVLTTFLVSCSAPTVSIPTTYSPEKIAQLQRFVTPLESYRENLTTLEGFIRDRNWTDTQTYIHGPLGSLRQTMTGLSRSLLPKDQQPALDLAKDLFAHFEQIDLAAKEKSLDDAQYHYQKAVEAFDAFLNVIPQGS